MVKINNQAVIQKLIDELRLYPSTDAIPTELAEKILPVFQINNEDINVNLKPVYFEWVDRTADDSNKTLTVPDNHTYVIKHGHIKYISTATVGNRTLTIFIKDADGNVVFTGGTEIDIAASKTRWISIVDVRSNFTGTNIMTYGDAGWDIGGGNSGFEIFMPLDFIMKENYTIQVYDKAAIDAAADEMEIYFLVEDIAD